MAGILDIIPPQIKKWGSVFCAVSIFIILAWLYFSVGSEGIAPKMEKSEIAPFDLTTVKAVSLSNAGDIKATLTYSVSSVDIIAGKKGRASVGRFILSNEAAVQFSFFRLPSGDYRFCIVTQSKDGELLTPCFIISDSGDYWGGISTAAICAGCRVKLVLN